MLAYQRCLESRRPFEEDEIDPTDTPRDQLESVERTRAREGSLFVILDGDRLSFEHQDEAFGLGRSLSQ